MEKTNRKRHLGGITPFSVFSILILTLVGALYIFSFRSERNHLEYKDDIITIEAVVSRAEKDSDLDRCLYVDYQLDGQYYRDVYWKTDNAEDHLRGDTVSIQVYPNGGLVKRDMGKLLPSLAGFWGFFAGLFVLVVLSFFDEKVKVDRDRIYAELYDKRFGFSALLMTAGASVITCTLLYGYHPTVLTVGIAIAVVGILLQWLSLYLFCRKQGKARYRWMRDVCTSCIDMGDSDTSDWHSTFRTLGGPFSLAMLSVGTEYHLLVDEDNVPQLAFDCQEYQLAERDTEFLQPQRLVRRIVAQCAIAVAVSILLLMLLHLIAGM